MDAGKAPAPVLLPPRLQLPPEAGTAAAATVCAANRRRLRVSPHSAEKRRQEVETEEGRGQKNKIVVVKHLQVLLTL